MRTCTGEPMNAAEALDLMLADEYEPADSDDEVLAAMLADAGYGGES